VWPAGSHRDFGPQQAAALYDPAKNQTIELPDFALRSGPRRTIYHNPKDVCAAIVTCEWQQQAQEAAGEHLPVDCQQRGGQPKAHCSRPRALEERRGGGCWWLSAGLAAGKGGRVLHQRTRVAVAASCILVHLQLRRAGTCMRVCAVQAGACAPD
jgi:hypothetical protein